MAEANSHWDGASYASNSSIQYEIRKSTLARHPFVGNEHVLDIGCGPGKMSYDLAQQLSRGRVVGVDNSVSMIDVARNTYGEQANLSFELKNVEELEYKSEFDVVVSSFCLQWVPGKANAFRGIRSSLKPGGTTILIMAHRNQEIAEIRKQMAAEPRWRKHFVNFEDPSDTLDDCDYESYARQAGLTISTFSVDTVKTQLPNKQAYIDRQAPLVPHLARLPDTALRKAFVDELFSRYFATVPEENGRVTHTYVLAKLIASRALS